MKTKIRKMKNKMKTYFATSNPGKFREIKQKFREAGLELGRINLQLVELQDLPQEQVALESARDAFVRHRKPLFVEDTGLYIKALNGFPGLYSAFVFKTLGNPGILKLMKGVKDRRAHFASVIAYKDAGQEKVFKGICRGNITRGELGQGGFGFDPIFIPSGHAKTFAQDYACKKKVSHRAKSTHKIINWLKKR